MKEEFPLEDTWLPFHLRPLTPPQGMPFTELFPGVDMKQRYATLNKAGEPYGIHFGERSFLSNSRAALEAGEYAADKGRFHSFHDHVFRAYFTDLLDIGDMQILLGLAADVGLDSDDLKHALITGVYVSRIEQALHEASTYGVSAVPTFIVNEKFRIVGAQPVDSFRERLRLIQGET